MKKEKHHHHEDGCCGHCHDHHGENSKETIIKIIIGAVIFILAILIKPIGLPLYILAYTVLGYEVIFSALKNIVKGRIFDENFLMSISTIGAFIIGEYPEAVAVMLFFNLGEFFEGLAVSKSRKSIKGLLNLTPEYANVWRDGGYIRENPEDVNIGDKILIKKGERVPLDCVIISGSSSLDQKSLTGESLPREVKTGDKILSGSINLSLNFEAEVLEEFNNSTAKRIMDMVENASSKKARAESFITAFAKIYTPIVVILALLIATLPPLILSLPFTPWVYKAFVFLVISCPCALVISVPLAFFAGIGTLSKNGVLVKGGSYLELLNKIDTVIFDKTGTLTKGSFEIKRVISEIDEAELLKIAASLEINSNHPIAKSITEGHTEFYKVYDFKEISGMGIEGKIEGEKIIIGNRELLIKNGIEAHTLKEIGTKLYIARENKYLGCIVIADALKEDSAAAIKGLKGLGIKKIFMLTGDNEEIAKDIASRLSLDGYFAALLPEEKVKKAEELSNGLRFAFVGDGINDAPLLLSADLGISMGNIGQAAAVEASDIVLANDSPLSICKALEVSKHTRKIVIQNIVFALLVKVIFLVLGVFGLTTMWAAVFSDVGVCLLAILNSIRILK